MFDPGGASDGEAEEGVDAMGHPLLELVESSEGVGDRRQRRWGPPLEELGEGVPTPASAGWSAGQALVSP
ncbi:hypothetical protein [Streptomyces sp. P9-A2]|uniref:hypothetical protein n=1 Tax=Streptomyces sp. P9-A2 TaxID=3072284 RepID=UPI002FC7263D